MQWKQGGENRRKFVTIFCLLIHMDNMKGVG